MVTKIFFAFLCSFIFISPVFADATAKTIFSPYADLTINAHWDQGTQAMEPIDLIQASKVSGVKNYHLAFITDAGRCQPAWGAQSDYAVTKAWGSHLTKKMAADNIKFTIAFGGANGSDISVACTESQLTSAYETIIKTYEPEGLDFDIENGFVNTGKMMSALKQIQNTHPDLKMSFTLPVMPEGLTLQGQQIVEQAKNNALQFTVNIMAMDYGAAYTGDMGDYAVSAATNLFKFLKTLYPEKTESAIWEMIAVTPMIGVNDVNVEQFTLKNADTLRSFAQQKHLAGIRFWSVARDNPCADKWASPTCSGNNLQTRPYEFSQRFLG